MTDDNNNEKRMLHQTIQKQFLEIERRGKIIMNLEEQLKELQENTLMISAQNKKLEAMVETAKKEREKFLEENEALEAKVKSATNKKKKTIVAV